MKKRILAWLLAMLTVCSILPAAAWADISDTWATSGSCGDHVQWSLSSNHSSLYIRGYGDMRDFSDDSSSAYKQPWSAYWPEIDYVSIDDEITRLGSFAFAYCSNLTDISIPAQATSIGYRTFYCSGIEYARFQGNSIKEISRGSFEGASFLKSIYLPSSVTFIDQSAFYGCASLTTVDIPSPDLTYIGDSAFYQCRKLNSITIASTKLAYIGANAFYQCNDLTDVYFGGTRAQWNRIKIEETGNQLLLYVATIHCADDPLPAPDMTLTNANNGKPTITWTAVDKAEQYEVYRSSDGINYSVIYQSSGLTYTDNSAAAGSTYYYKVRAKNANSTGHFCDAASIASLAAPARPSLTLTTDRSGKPVLKWTSVKDATAYEVFRSTTGAAGSFSIVRRTSYLTWTDANTEMDKTYYYVVRAKNGSLCGKFSPAQSVKCPIVLSAPSMTLDLNKSTGKPVISWTSVPFATQYEIYRSATGADKSYRIIRRTALLNYTDTTAASGTTYYYVVRAMRGTGSSVIYSRFCKAQSTTSAVLPSTPTVTLRIDDTTGKPVISWSKTANAAQYEIYRSTTGADKSYRIIRRTALLNYTDTTAVAGTTYYYVVRAIQGTSPNIFRGRFCPAQSIRCAAVPGVPDMALTTDIDTGHIVISWSAATDAAQYEVFRSTDGSSFSSVCRTAALTWTDPTTENGVAYYYKVRGITDSVKGAFCKAQSIAVPGVPSMTLSNDSVTGRNVVSWSSVACATEYEVYRSANGEDYQSILRANTLTYTDLDTDYGVTYSYKVRAIYSVSPVMVFGSFCTPNSIRCVALLPVSGLTMSTDDEIGLNVANWESVCGAESYEVYRSTDGETYQRAGSTRELTYIDNDASEYGVTYYYKVRARNSNTVGDFSQPQSIQCVFKIIASGTWQTDYPIAWAGHTGRWTLYGNGTLVISGNRVTMPWFKKDTVPWDAYRDKIWSVVIRSGVANIGGYSFYNCSNLTRITIPDSVTSIGNYAFYECSSLTNITIPNRVISIEDSAFYRCGLTSVIIPDSVTSIGNSAFYGCSSLTNITIPNSVTSIGDSAFSWCSSLTNITIPDSVTTIGESAFEDCIRLTNVTIPDSVSAIGESTFKGCSNLTNVTIPDSITTIGESAFKGCSSLTNVTIPDSVTSIGTSAFYGCSSLTNITIPDSVIEIGSYAFGYCRSLTNITIPGSVTSIMKYAFDHCSRLTSVTILKGVTEISAGAFSYCSNLTSVTIPNSVTSIGGDTFASCTSLRSITIPDSVTSIGTWAFSRCSNLTSIAIPSSVRFIGDSAFYSCSNLKKVYYSGSEEQWRAIVIQDYSGGDHNAPLDSATILYNQTEPWR